LEIEIPANLLKKTVIVVTFLEEVNLFNKKQTPVQAGITILKIHDSTEALIITLFQDLIYLKSLAIELQTAISVKSNGGIGFNQECQRDYAKYVFTLEK